MSEYKTLKFTKIHGAFSPPQQTEIDSFSQTFFDHAILSLSDEFQQADGIRYVVEFAQNAAAQKLISGAAKAIDPRNSCKIKNRLSFRLQRHIETILGYGPQHDVLGRGPNTVYVKDSFFPSLPLLGPTKFPILDPIRPVVIMAQIYMIEQWADNNGYENKYQKFAGSDLAQQCMKDAYTIFTTHHGVFTDKNVFMLLGPAGFGKSVLQVSTIAYIVSRKFPISVISSPTVQNLHPNDRHKLIFGSWSVDFASPQTSQISISTCVDHSLKYLSQPEYYFSQLELHLNELSSTPRIFLIDPREATAGIKETNETTELCHLQRFHDVICSLAKNSKSLFFSVHSMPIIKYPQEGKSGPSSLWANYPNFTLLNMPFTHPTLLLTCHKFESHPTTPPCLDYCPQIKVHKNIIFTSDLISDKLYKLHLCAAPTIRSYFRFLLPFDLQTEAVKEGTFRIDNAILNPLIYDKMTGALAQSFCHDHNPDVRTNQTYISPLLRAYIDGVQSTFVHSIQITPVWNIGDTAADTEDIDDLDDIVNAINDNFHVYDEGDHDDFLHSTDHNYSRDHNYSPDRHNFFPKTFY